MRKHYAERFARSRLMIFMHQRPTTFAVVVIAIVLPLVWWLGGDWSPLP